MSINVPEGVLSSILERLDRLERSAPGAQEALIPNSYTIDAAGNVVVVGIDLPAGITSTPPNRSRIRWLRQSDGAVAADLTAYSTSGVEAFKAAAYALAASDESWSMLEAIDDGGNVQASVIARYNWHAAGTTGSIDLAAGIQNRALLYQDGRSSFMQIGAAASLSTTGAFQLGWPGGANISTSGIITPFGFTNLGGVLAVADETRPAGLLTVCGVSYTGGAGFQVIGYTPQGNPPAGAQSTVAWLAWGT